MKLIRIATYALIAVFIGASLVCASDIVPTPKVISENALLFQWILGLILLIALYLLAKMIKASETNNDMQWKAINSLSTMFKTMHDEFIEIRTEHKMNHQNKE